MEKLASFYAANKEMKSRPFICDYYQKSVLEIFSNSAGEKSGLFNFDKVYDFNESNDKLIDWMKLEGFCMLVRASDKFERYFTSLNSHINLDESILIYSLWNEYINPESRHANKKYLDFTKYFPETIKLHTSGHATADVLAKVCSLVNPTTGIIPIHSEKSVAFYNLPISLGLKEKIITTSMQKRDVEVKIVNNQIN